MYICSGIGFLITLIFSVGILWHICKLHDRNLLEITCKEFALYALSLFYFYFFGEAVKSPRNFSGASKPCFHRRYERGEVFSYHCKRQHCKRSETRRLHIHNEATRMYSQNRIASLPAIMWYANVSLILFSV